MSGAATTPPQVGDVLPSLDLPALTRTTIALYAGGSGDHMPLHIDSDFAKAAGHPDVFMHGSLGMAYLGRMLEQSVSPAAIRELQFRFRAITYPGEALTATGRVVEQVAEHEVRVEMALANEGGEVKISGTALLRLDLPG